MTTELDQTQELGKSRDSKYYNDLLNTLKLMNSTEGQSDFQKTSSQMMAPKFMSLGTNIRKKINILDGPEVSPAQRTIKFKRFQMKKGGRAVNYPKRDSLSKIMHKIPSINDPHHEVPFRMAESNLVENNSNYSQQSSPVNPESLMNETNEPELADLKNPASANPIRISSKESIAKLSSETNTQIINNASRNASLTRLDSSIIEQYGEDTYPSLNPQLRLPDFTASNTASNKKFLNRLDVQKNLRMKYTEKNIKLKSSIQSGKHSTPMSCTGQVVLPQINCKGIASLVPSNDGPNPGYSNIY